jgi:tmRNA-binding protein
VGVGKTSYDKRESIAERESNRDIQRAMSKRMKR